MKKGKNECRALTSYSKIPADTEGLLAPSGYFFDCGPGMHGVLAGLMGMENYEAQGYIRIGTFGKGLEVWEPETYVGRSRRPVQLTQSQVDTLWEYFNRTGVKVPSWFRKYLGEEQNPRAFSTKPPRGKTEKWLRMVIEEIKAGHDVSEHMKKQPTWVQDRIRKLAFHEVYTGKVYAPRLKAKPVLREVTKAGKPKKAKAAPKAAMAKVEKTLDARKLAEAKKTAERALQEIMAPPKQKMVSLAERYLAAVKAQDKKAQEKFLSPFRTQTINVGGKVSSYVFDDGSSVGYVRNEKGDIVTVELSDMSGNVEEFSMSKKNPAELVIFSNPMPNFHVAVTYPYNKIARIAGKKVPHAGLQMLLAVPKAKGKGTVLYQVHFGREHYTPAQAKAWLKKYHLKAIKFYAATVKNPVEGTQGDWDRLRSAIDALAKDLYTSRVGDRKSEILSALGPVGGPYPWREMPVDVLRIAREWMAMHGRENPVSHREVKACLKKIEKHVKEEERNPKTKAQREREREITRNVKCPVCGATMGDCRTCMGLDCYPHSRRVEMAERLKQKKEKRKNPGDTWTLGVEGKCPKCWARLLKGYPELAKAVKSGYAQVGFSVVQTLRNLGLTAAVGVCPHGKTPILVEAAARKNPLSPGQTYSLKEIEQYLSPEEKRELAKAKAQCKGPFHAKELQVVVAKVPKGTSKVLVGQGVLNEIKYEGFEGSHLDGSLMYHEAGDKGRGKKGKPVILTWDPIRKTYVFAGYPGAKMVFNKKKGIVG